MQRHMHFHLSDLVIPCWEFYFLHFEQNNASSINNFHLFKYILSLKYIVSSPSHKFYTCTELILFLRKYFCQSRTHLNWRFLGRLVICHNEMYIQSSKNILLPRNFHIWYQCLYFTWPGPNNEVMLTCLDPFDMFVCKCLPL